MRKGFPCHDITLTLPLDPTEQYSMKYTHPIIYFQRIKCTWLIPRNALNTFWTTAVESTSAQRDKFPHDHGTMVRWAKRDYSSHSLLKCSEISWELDGCFECCYHSRLIPMYNARFILRPPSFSSPIRKGRERRWPRCIKKGVAYRYQATVAVT